jgi:hypothetical protein
MMNVDLLFCGITVGVRRAERGWPANRREEFEWLPEFAGTLPVRINHCPVITSSGVYDAGWVSCFAIVDGPPPIPAASRV